MTRKSPKCWSVAIVVVAVGVMAGGVDAQVRVPFPSGTPHAIPGTIEAEDFDQWQDGSGVVLDGEGNTYHDTTAEGNAGATYRTAPENVDIKVAIGSDHTEGTVVYAVAAGEWLEYTVNVASAGTYKLTIRLALASTKTPMQFKLDGNDLTPMTTLPTNNNNRFCEFAWTVSLPDGQHILRFEIGGAAPASAEDLKINWFKFEAYAETFNRPGLAFWRFDNDGGGPTVLDQTANGNNGTASNVAYLTTIPVVAFPFIQYPGGTTPTPTVAPNDAPLPNWPAHGTPRNSTAADFERDLGAYIAVPDSSALDMGAEKSWTLEAWVKLETPGDILDGNSRQWLVHKKAAATDEFTDFGVLVNGGPYVSNPTWVNPEPSWTGYAGLTGKEIVVLFGRSDGSGVDTAVSRLQVYDPAASGGTLWHYVMVSYDAAKDEVIFVVDNLPPERIQGVTPTNVANDGQLVIGGHVKPDGTVNQTFDGQIDELWIDSQPLAGTPGNTGAPLYVPWFWENDGVALDGMFTTNGLAPWRPRPAGKMNEDNTCLWQRETDPSDGTNSILHLYDGNDLTASYFYDFDTTTDADSAYSKQSCTPQNLSQGVTWVCRFKFTSHENNDISGNDRQKFIRFVCDLKDNTTANAYFEVRVTYADEIARTGIALRSTDGASGGILSPDIAGGWHTVHGAAYSLPSGEVQHHLYLDGNMTPFASYVRTAMQTSYDPYVGFNDNGRRFATNAYVDYLKISGAGGAWAPDGTKLGTWLEICDNGVDDDGDTLADCADPDCLGWKTEVCNNGVDDDCDGYTDCADADCANDPICCTHDPAYDVDDDGDVDQADFAVFQACYMADWATISIDCRCMESDGDNDIDQAEYDAFEACASGAGIPANTACDD